jgi:hypothetical protein
VNLSMDSSYLSKSIRILAICISAIPM